MSKLRIHHRKAKHEVGRSPGSLVFQGTQKMGEPSIHLMAYNLETLEESVVELDEITTLVSMPDKLVWLNVHGVHDAELVRKIGEKYGLHPLLLEDVMNPGQRPKLDVYDDYLFLVLKMLDQLEGKKEVLEEQICLVVGHGLLITFQEQEGDIFEQVRHRIRNKMGKIRSRGSDYLAYALLDAIVDEYFIILDTISDELDELEDQMVGASDPLRYIGRMQTLKREIIRFRRYISPTREVVGGLCRTDSEIVKQDTVIFLTDVQDHAIQVSETLDSFRDILGSIQDLHLSVVNNKMNEVMKVLAGISTIFLPMTLVAGIYGMNFDFMPELDVKWGYPASLGMMLAIGVGMYIYFRTRKWF
jgi:magnesium transporter